MTDSFSTRDTLEVNGKQLLDFQPGEARPSASTSRACRIR